MGDFKKHLELAKEKLKATISAYNKKQNTVVGDMGTKVVEQLIEADAARNNNILVTTIVGMSTLINIIIEILTKL